MSALPIDLPDPADVARLARQAPHELRHPDGRTLAVADLGAPDGVPLFWFHGAPSCRLEAILAHRWAAEAGVRLLAPDRPGLGHSTPQTGQALASWGDDVVAIADALDLATFAVIGGSGGGPYVLAVAARAPRRVTLAVASAPGGVLHTASSAAGWVDRAAATLARRAAPVLGAYFRLMGLGAHVPPSLLRRVAWLDPGPEGPALRDPAVATLAPFVLRETFRQGVRGAIDDYRRLGSPWELDLGAIDVAVRYVQGDRDPFVPVAHTRALAAATAGAHYEERAGAGHFGAIFDLEPVATALHP